MPSNECLTVLNRKESRDKSKNHTEMIFFVVAPGVITNVSCKGSSPRVTHDGIFLKFISILNNALARNPEMFRCTEEDKMEELLNCNAKKFASFVGKTWKKNVSRVCLCNIVCNLYHYYGVGRLFLRNLFLLTFWHLVCLSVFGVW